MQSTILILKNKWLSKKKSVHLSVWLSVWVFVWSELTCNSVYKCHYHSICTLFPTRIPIIRLSYEHACDDCGAELVDSIYGLRLYNVEKKNEKNIWGLLKWADRFADKLHLICNLYTTAFRWWDCIQSIWVLNVCSYLLSCIFFYFKFLQQFNTPML